MCNSIFNHRLAPLNKRHLEKVIEIFPHQAGFAKEVFRVLTKNLTPQTNLLVAFVLLKEQYDVGRKGIFSSFGKILYAPLSIVAKTGEHEWTRFRPQPVEELHTSFLSFMMAKPNRRALNNLLGRYGLCFSQAHCCGILFGKKNDVSSFEKSDLFKRRNLMRSYAEAMAMPVSETDFEDIPGVTSDLGQTEIEFYDLYQIVFDRIGSQKIENYQNNQMDRIWNEIIISQTEDLFFIKNRVAQKASV